MALGPLDRVLSPPAELIQGLRVLPEIAKHTAAMAEFTSVLPRMEREIAKVAKAMWAPSI